MDNYIDLLFMVAPGSDSEFVESENMAGQSIRAGEWIPPSDDTFWRLRIRPEVFDRAQDERVLEVS